MLWIKEEEMVESVDDLKSPSSIGGIQTPDFEVIDAKIASALNRIIHNSRVSEKLKTVLELYNLEIHLKQAGPDYLTIKN